MRKDTHALEHTRFAHGGQLADLGTEYCHACQIAAHHQQGTNEHEDGLLEEEQQDISRRQPQKAQPRGKAKALLVVDLTPQGGDHRGQHDSGCHDEYVILHTQGDLIVEDEVGHEDLNGDVEQDKGDEIQV